MKSRINFLLRPIGAILLLLLPACSTHPKQARVQPVGPAPIANRSHEHAGYLVVYSAWSNFVDQGSTGITAAIPLRLTMALGPEKLSTMSIGLTKAQSACPCPPVPITFVPARLTLGVSTCRL